MEKAKRVEESNIDAELEYDIAHARDQHEADRERHFREKGGLSSEI
jgi:hypothetical protein